jgi:hypothetical protein
MMVIGAHSWAYGMHEQAINPYYRTGKIRSHGGTHCSYVVSRGRSSLARSRTSFPRSATFAFERRVVLFGNALDGNRENDSLEGLSALVCSPGSPSCTSHLPIILTVREPKPRLSQDGDCLKGSCRINPKEHNGSCSYTVATPHGPSFLT